MRPSLFLSHALERLAIFLDVHESTGFRVTLDPLLRHRVENLRSITLRSIAVTIASRRIRCHRSTLFNRRTQQDRKDSRIQ
jgi:hypothetical protein